MFIKHYWLQRLTFVFFHMPTLVVLLHIYSISVWSWVLLRRFNTIRVNAVQDSKGDYIILLPNFEHSTKCSHMKDSKFFHVFVVQDPQFTFTVKRRNDHFIVHLQLCWQVNIILVEPSVSPQFQTCFTDSK